MIEAGFFLLGAALASVGTAVLVTNHYEQKLRDAQARHDAEMAALELRSSVKVTPASKTLFVDRTDGQVKVKDSTGAVVTIHPSTWDIDLPLGPAS